MLLVCMLLSCQFANPHPAQGLALNTNLHSLIVSLTHTNHALRHVLGFQQCHSVQVARSEGLPGFYHGFGAVLSGVVPATALYFGGYETGKRLVPASYGVLGDMLVGCYTQAIAGIVFTPVDIIKERMQVRYSLPGPCKHKSRIFQPWSEPCNSWPLESYLALVARQTLQPASPTQATYGAPPCLCHGTCGLYQGDLCTTSGSLRRSVSCNVFSMPDNTSMRRHTVANTATQLICIVSSFKLPTLPLLLSVDCIVSLVGCLPRRE